MENKLLSTKGPQEISIKASPLLKVIKLYILLAPLGRFKYIVDNSKPFVEQIKNKQVREGYEMISFDVISLFTNVLLDITIDMILKVYDEKLINTSIKREDMKSLLLLCTKSVPFTFNDDMYIQIQDVAMGSPLGP